MDLWADNIALMTIWCGSTSVPFGLHIASGTDPHSFSIISIGTLQIVPALLQMVPGLKESKTEVSG